MFTTPDGCICGLQVAYDKEISIMESLGKYRVLDGGLATELILQHNLTVTVMHS